jgi:hypothetical protein
MRRADLDFDFQTGRTNRSEQPGRPPRRKCQRDNHRRRERRWGLRLRKPQRLRNGIGQQLFASLAAVFAGDSFLLAVER